jgi:hypothetical protein
MDEWISTKGSVDNHWVSSNSNRCFQIECIYIPTFNMHLIWNLYANYWLYPLQRTRSSCVKEVVETRAHANGPVPSGPK